MTNYTQNNRPNYVLGNAACLASSVLCLTTILAQIAYLHWENGKREKGDRDHRLSEGKIEDLGNRHPAFKYTL